MHSVEIIDRVKETFEANRSIRKTAKIYNLPTSTVQYMVKNDYKKTKKDIGRPRSIGSKENTRIKKEIRSLNASGSIVTARKVLKNLDLNVSVRTMRRRINSLGFKYKKIQNKIQLSKKHQQNRLAFAENHLKVNHPWNLTVFSDEKRFRLDGPDNLYSLMDPNNPMVRNRRQLGGGGIMVWGMVLPDGMIWLKKLEGKQKSENYIDLIDQYVKPILDNYFKSDNYYFQQDNCSIHVSAKSRTFLQSSFANVLDWPSKSPDLNPIENIWKLISDHVYESKQYNSTKELWKAVQKAADHLYTKERQKIIAILSSMNQRLIDVVKNKGGITKY